MYWHNQGINQNLTKNSYIRIYRSLYAPNMRDLDMRLSLQNRDSCERYVISDPVWVFLFEHAI